MCDITMCDNYKCPLRDMCYRYRAIPDKYWQSFSHFVPVTFPLGPGTITKCDYFWNIDKRNKKDIKWLDTRQKNELQLSDEQHIFCCCGKIASALHENCCRRFQEKVNKATVKELEPLYKAEQKDK